jgi:hypothetical protein
MIEQDDLTTQSLSIESSPIETVAAGTALSTSPVQGMSLREELLHIRWLLSV